jgi:hypothetical protein
VIAIYPNTQIPLFLSILDFETSSGVFSIVICSLNYFFSVVDGEQNVRNSTVLGILSLYSYRDFD